MSRESGTPAWCSTSSDGAEQSGRSPRLRGEGLLDVMSVELKRLDDELWEIPASARADMRVPARIFADREMLDAIAQDGSLEQLQNVATLPGIVDAAMAMPDIHQGY